MEVAILIMVTFLVAVQVLGLFGLTNGRTRNEAAKRIAQELHDLRRAERLRPETPNTGKKVRIG